MDEEKIKKLENGVSIYNDKSIITAPARIEKVKEAKLRDIAHLTDEDPLRLKLTKRGELLVTLVKITITEGKKHQVKRMAKSVGMNVIYLERIEIAGVKLDETLPRGSYRPLTDEELAIIKNDM